MTVIGLTGSIGMGKSSLGAMMEYLGVSVHDADACVHGLLQFNSPAWPTFTAAFPYFRYPQIYKKRFSFSRWRHGGSAFKREIDRAALGRLIFKDEDLRIKLESVLHPFVRQAQRDFIRVERSLGRTMVALDVPLLFETGGDVCVDYTVSVSAPDFIQHQRVLSRNGMDEAKFSAIVARQMPDGEKRARADFVVHSGLGRAHMMRELRNVLTKIKQYERCAA